MHLDALLGYLQEALAQTNVRCFVAVGDTHLLVRDRDETTDPKAEACPQSNKVETCAKEERFICKLHVILSMTIPQVRGNHRNFGSAPAPWPLVPRRYYVDLNRGQKKKETSQPSSSLEPSGRWLLRTRETISDGRIWVAEWHQPRRAQVVPQFRMSFVSLTAIRVF